MKRLATLAAVVIIATGCAAPATTTPTTSAPSEAAAEATPTPVTMGPGDYTFESLTGATGTMTIPGKPDATVEKLRALAKGPAVTYLTVKVDNRKGTADVNMYGVSLFTPAGEELQYKGASTYVDSITPDGAPTEVYNQFIEGYNKLNDPVKPGAVAEVVLTGPAVPAEFSRVTVYPSGMSDPVDALPAS